MSTHFKGPVVSENGFEGAITGNITGNLTGNVTGNLVGNQSGGSVAATVLTASTSAAVGSGGAVIKAIKTGAATLTVSALAAATQEDLSLTITGAAAGDIVILMPPNAALEPALGVVGAWVSGANTAKVRIANLDPVSPLVGGANDWNYLWIDLT